MWTPGGWRRWNGLMRPPDSVTYAEAAHILGVTPSTVRRHVLAARLSQPEPGRHRMLSRAAEILGVNVSRARYLAVRGRIPAERHADGTWMFRREQLLAVANAREARAARQISEDCG